MMRKVPWNYKTYEIVLQWHSNFDRPQEVMKLVEEMKEKGMQLNQTVYNIMIEAFRRVKDFEAMERRLEEMMKDSVQPNQLTLTLFLEVFAALSYRSERYLRNMFKCAEDFKKLGISPDKRGEKVMRDLFWKRGEFARYKAFEQQLNDMQIPAPQRQEAVA